MLPPLLQVGDITRQGELLHNEAAEIRAAGESSASAGPGASSIRRMQRTISNSISSISNNKPKNAKCHMFLFDKSLVICLDLSRFDNYFCYLHIYRYLLSITSLNNIFQWNDGKETF